MASRSAAVKQDLSLRGKLGGEAIRKPDKINSLRKRTTSKLSYSQRYAKLEELSGEAIDKLAYLMRNGSSEAIQQSSAIEILNRTDGKPRQAATLDVKTDLTSLHLDALRALAAQAPDLIDITPVNNG